MPGASRLYQAQFQFWMTVYVVTRPRNHAGHVSKDHSIVPALSHRTGSQRVCT